MNGSLPSPEPDAFGPGPTGLYRDPAHGRIAGVCAGLANYFGIGVGAMRLSVIVLGCVFLGPVLFGYVLLAVLLPRRPAQLYRDSADEAFWHSVARHPANTVGGLSRRFRALEDRLARMERRVTSPDEALRARFRDL
jgi:phage shock protein C